MTMGTRTMRQVVERLRGENAEALLELYEFEYAMSEVLRHVEALAVGLRELEAEIARIGAEGDPSDPTAARALREHCARLTTRAEHIAAAFAQFWRGLEAWGISDSG